MTKVTSETRPDSPMPQTPVVRNAWSEGILAFDLVRVVGMGSAVGHDRDPGSASLEAVPDERRDRHQGVVLLAYEQLHQRPSGRGTGTIVEEHELDRAHDD